MSPATCYPPREIRWCVTDNLEYRKCETMRSAVYAYNIYPHIFCVQESSQEMCMEALQKNLADVFVTMPKEEPDAIKYEIQTFCIKDSDSSLIQFTIKKLNQSKKIMLQV